MSQKIQTKHARWLVKKYRENKLGKTLSELDTRAVWFDRTEIVDALKDQVVGGSTVKVGGLRFYFGAHDDAAMPQKQHRITLIMVSTADGTKKDILENPGAGPAKPPKPTLHFNEFDDAHLCPPDCDDDGLGNF